MVRSLVDEVDPDAVQRDPRVIQGIQLTLASTPIELVSPVGQQAAQVTEIGALAPGRIRR